jgi:hypothetical protein
MRYLQVLLVAVVSFAAACAIAPAASIAAPPPCPANLNALGLRIPSYGRAGQSLAAEIFANRPERISEVTIASVHEAEEVVTPVAITGRKTTVVIPPNPVEPEFEVELRWKQGEGTAAACEGTVAYVIPIIPANATAGTPLAPRLVGRFRVVEHAVGPRRGVTKPVWLLKPRCHYFACATTVRSSLSLHGTFQLLANGGYELLTAYRPTLACEELSTHRIVVRRGYRQVVRVRIEVSKSPLANQVDSFVGTIDSHYEATPRARAKGCPRTAAHSVERIRGRRIQS